MAATHDTPAHDASHSGDLPRLPLWLRSKRADTLADAAFLSGAAMAHLDHVLTLPTVPHAVLRARLALLAAEACVRHLGRPERMADLRDTLHLLRPGDLPGPAGEVAAVWHHAVAQPLSAQTLARALPRADAALPAEAMAPGRTSPIPHAAALLQATVAQDPRGQTAALLLADAALSRGLGWEHLVPLLSLGLPRGALRAQDADLQMACHHAVTRAVPQVLRQAADLADRMLRLQAVTPRLRAKTAGQAVALVLSRDAVAPVALTGFMSDRAARRLCDRLVALGAVRELTGRDTFRLYGL